jgi:hypothetical protein
MWVPDGPGMAFPWPLCFRRLSRSRIRLLSSSATAFELARLSDMSTVVPKMKSRSYFFLPSLESNAQVAPVWRHWLQALCPGSTLHYVYLSQHSTSNTPLTLMRLFRQLRHAMDARRLRRAEKSVSVVELIVACSCGCSMDVK